jgi:hypothetical protein
MAASRPAPSLSSVDGWAVRVAKEAPMLHPSISAGLAEERHAARRAEARHRRLARLVRRPAAEVKVDPRPVRPAASARVGAQG